jgi:hypothetical protein
MKALVIATCAVAASLSFASHAYAQPDDDAYEREMTIKLSQIADEIDDIPTCMMEDGSDVIPAHGGRCLWMNDGNTWLTYEDRSFLIVDDSVVSAPRVVCSTYGRCDLYDDGAFEQGTFVGGYN